TDRRVHPPPVRSPLLVGRVTPRFQDRLNCLSGPHNLCRLLLVWLLRSHHGSNRLRHQTFAVELLHDLGGAEDGTESRLFVSRSRILRMVRRILFRSWVRPKPIRLAVGTELIEGAERLPFLISYKCPCSMLLANLKELTVFLCCVRQILYRTLETESPSLRLL